MSDLMAVVLTGIGTLMMRASFVVALARRRISEPVLAILELVGPAVLGALVLSLLVGPDGGLAVGVPEAAGLLVGGVLAYRTRNLVVMVVAGMAAYWALRAVI
jgi:branched-subunit amino acid transport protein